MTVATVENFRLRAALDYAALGWRVFPLHHPMTSPTSTRCSCGAADCESIGKHPRTANGLHDATDERDMITAWWERHPAANIGIATGQLSGLYVIDIDSGKGGESSWQELVDSYGEPPPTLAVETGGGGAHLLFRYPAGKSLRNTTGKLGAGIDTRGEGGYIVAAPSLHASGTRYSWRVAPGEALVAEIPEWVTLLLHEPVKPRTPVRQLRDNGGEYWLNRALQFAQVGQRNESGLWLACQLRDNGTSEREAEQILLVYAQRVPRGEKTYTDKEALQSVRSAYSRPPRQPAKRDQLEQRQQVTPTLAPVNATPQQGAAHELNEFLYDVIDKRVVAVPFPRWPILTELTQALIPGTTTVIVGDPGVGKTYFILQCLLAWQAQGIDAAGYFIEKNRRFHMMRLLAQLMADPKYLDFTWIAEHGDSVKAAMALHQSTIDEIGRHVYSTGGKRVNLNNVLGWITQMASAGRRVIIVDPITAVDAGAERWTKDDDFVLAAEHTAAQHGASLIFVTHAKKGNRPNSPTGHDAAGGAAWFRFCDTLLWLNKPKKPRRVRVVATNGLPFTTTPHLFFQIHKARNGKGTSCEVAFNFGDGLRFSEQGLVQADVKDTALEDQ